VKPIARWQIWLGKWLGLLSLNAALLAISGASVFALLQWRATRLPVEQQKVLRNEVLVSRGSAREPDQTADIERETDRQMKLRLEKNPVAQVDLAEVRKQVLEQVKAVYQVVPPGYSRGWEIKVPKDTSRDRPLYVRIKFNAANGNTSGTFVGLWQVGDPRKTQIWRSEPMSLAPETFHEFEVPPYFDDSGVLTVTFVNPNDTSLLFPLEDGFEVLYREGGFVLNFARGLGIIFCWMAMLAALGLAAASFLSFPVAAFLSLAILSMALFSGPLSSAVSEGTLGNYNAEKGTKGHLAIDVVAIPVFRAVLNVINLAKGFSPIDSLSTGRSITWTQLGQAIAQIILLLGGILAVFGITVFTRRELATAQGTQ
jgi:ABC-type transport system involved in multi-copper enzyme maturation permease subunit